MSAALPPPSNDFATVPDTTGGAGEEPVTFIDPPKPGLVATPSDFAPDPTISVGEATANPGVPMGPTTSETMSKARVIDDDEPERVPVYPDDPNSAWWEINPRYAFERAQREQKPMLLLFTGIWNAQAMALSQEVFATKSFNEYVKENLVICYLNYPRNFTDAPDALRRIKDKFKVRGYPNVLLFHPNGEVQRGLRGYRTGRPVDYFNQLVGACYPVLVSIEAHKQDLVNQGYRDWSNYMGKLLFARFVARDEARVMLQDASGQRWTIPINDLAPDDQRMVESFPPVKTSGASANKEQQK